jgi:hypothetical protein
MARMNEVLMTNVSEKTKGIFNKTGMTRKAFCDRLQIPGSYLSSIHNTANWEKIPAWAWFLFQDLTNGKIVFNNKGEITHIYDGHTLEEVHEDCKQRAENFLFNKRSSTEEIVTITTKGVIIPLTDKAAIDDVVTREEMEVRKVAKDYSPKLIDEDFAVQFATWWIDNLIQTKQESIKSLRELKKEISKWKKKKT